MARVVMNGSSAAWTGASQAKYEALTTMQHSIKQRVDELRAATIGVTYLFFSSGKNAGLVLVRAADGSATSVLRWITTAGVLIVESSGFDFALMPANGNDVRVDASYTSGGAATFRVRNLVTNTDVLNSTSGSALPALSTAAGSGEFYPRYGAWDAWAIFSSVRSGDALNVRPRSTDADVVGLHFFPEGSGLTSVDLRGGNPFVLDTSTWDAAGEWDANVPRLEAYQIFF